MSLIQTILNDATTEELEDEAEKNLSQTFIPWDD